MFFLKYQQKPKSEANLWTELKPEGLRAIKIDR
jgi:hypothetical protein